MMLLLLTSLTRSLSARRAWIEMPPGLACSAICTTSLSARRAWIEITVSTTIITICIVALRKESVDRNCICIIQLIESGLSLSARRAWIEMFLKRSKTMKNRSLSARRAWIEILLQRQGRRLGAVALRKESVDRNNVTGSYAGSSSGVALRKESVDRNALY